MPDESCSCCKALWVKFTLIQKLTTTDAAKLAVVYDDGSERHFWQGEDPDPNDAGFLVYNLEEKLSVPGVYQFSGEVGDVGLACLDESLPDTDRYRIVTLSKKPPIVVRFKLTATLSNGGSAAAVIRTFNGSSYVDGSSIVVFDWYHDTTQSPGTTQGMWQGVSGMEGLALKRETPSVSGQEQYDIIWMEQYAWDCEVTLSSNPTFSGTQYASSWTATATVDSVGGIVQAFHQGVSPGLSITIHDDQVMYPFAKDGAKAKVIRSENEGSAPYYKVVACQQLALTGRATLSGAQCGNDPLTVTGFTVTSPSPFNLNPSITSAKNPRFHGGYHGDDVWLAFNKADASYEAIDVEKHYLGVITDLRENPNNHLWLQAGYRTILTELCSGAVYYLDLMHLRQFNWWCSGNYYCSGAAGSSGSGSGSGATGATCNCTTIASTLKATFVGGHPCWDGGQVTLTKSGSTWTGTATIGGESWTVTWNCSALSSGVMSGTVRVQGPACLATGADQTVLIDTGAINSCSPLHVETGFTWTTTGHIGCSSCANSTGPYNMKIVITEP